MEDRQRHRELCKELALKNKKYKEEPAELKEAAKGQLLVVQQAMQERDETMKILGKANQIITGLVDFLNQEERATWIDIRQHLEHRIIVK